LQDVVGKSPQKFELDLVFVGIIGRFDANNGGIAPGFAVAISRKHVLFIPNIASAAARGALRRD
jgi:hypothetical protein